MWRGLALAIVAAGCHASISNDVSSDAGDHGTVDASDDSGGGGIVDAPPDAPQCFNGRLIYLNFGGVTLTKGSSDATTNTAKWMQKAQGTAPPYHQNSASRTIATAPANGVPNPVARRTVTRTQHTMD